MAGFCLEGKNHLLQQSQHVQNSKSNITDCFKKSLYLKDGDASELERTRQYMHEAFQSGAMTCLICIASVKRNQAVSILLSSFRIKEI